jgi:hypothetical protein
MMPSPSHPCVGNCRALVSLLPALLLIGACSPPVQRPTGVAYDYDAAKDMLKRGRFDRVLEFTDDIYKASPPNAFTERARVLRVAVLSGEVTAYIELTDAYRKGADNTKEARIKVEFERLRHDYLQYGSTRALALGEVAHTYTEIKTLPKEVVLDASYPTAEAPLTVPGLTRVMEGGWIEAPEQDAAIHGAQLKGIEDALAEMVGGDRTKARTMLTAGPVKIDGVDYALYLGKWLLQCATLYDRNHADDPAKAEPICSEAMGLADLALAMLKESPNKDKENAVKQLQEDVKRTLKNI